jgi:hypothetical protein
MQLPTLTITCDEAREDLARYRRARRDGVVWTLEDQRMLDAYRVIASGKPVIDLHRAIALAGVRRMAYTDERWNGREHRTYTVQYGVDVPVLAVARADRRFCWTRGITVAGGVHTFSDLAASNEEHRRRDRCDIDELFARDESRHELPWRIFYRAVVPPVPPHLRPMHTKGFAAGSQWRQVRVQSDLSRYHVLWEAEWELDRTVPPGDPALLKHLGGTLYAVVAQWDLTPVEAAVLAGREPTAAELARR